MRSLAAVLLLCTATLPCAADEVSKAKSTEELLALMNADKMVDQMFEQMQTMIRSQLSSMPAPAGKETQAKAMAADIQTQMFDLIRKRMSWDRMKPEYMRMYAETFSEDEINGMVAFYRSPAGRATLEKLPLVMSKTMAIVQPMMKELTPEIQRITEKASEKYGLKK